jgi:hypothetical protein
MSTTMKYNSKGQLIEQLDCTPICTRGSFQSLKPTSPKRANIDLLKTTSDLAAPLAAPFPNAQQAEILAWCEAYQNLKKRGINIYKI